MAGFNAKEDSGLIGDINVTPFVDIALVLLIIFMSTSVVIVRTALDLEIPVASNAEAKDESFIQSVRLKSDNSIELNGEEVSPSELVTALQQVVAANKTQRPAKADTQALISASPSHNFQQVVDLIDLVKGTGIAMIALNTKTKEVEETP